MRKTRLASSFGPKFLAICALSAAQAQESHEHHHHDATMPVDCAEGESWDYSQSMCQPLPEVDERVARLMIHGQAFAVGAFTGGPRGRSAFAAPNMFMLDAGSSLGRRQFVNLNLMTTFEKWTFPTRGYPLLMQTGESDANGIPYVDAQHPHSSPIMGLTLSDRIHLGTGPEDHLRFSFAPRGESCDGPVPFMHRPTATLNPDAPLGHHVGQDVGHISSTVFGAAWRFGDSTIEVTAFHGDEPEPTRVDMPMGRPNSFSARYTLDFAASAFAMVSFASVDPGAHAAAGGGGHEREERFSASIYNRFFMENGGSWHNAFIYGSVNDLDGIASLASLAEEFAVRWERPRVWGRFEILQRAPIQLGITTTTAASTYWVGSWTLGYSHLVQRFGAGLELTLGASVSQSFLPSAVSVAYGGNPWSGKIFLQLGGMKGWEI